MDSNEERTTDRPIPSPHSFASDGPGSDVDSFLLPEGDGQELMPSWAFESAPPQSPSKSAATLGAMVEESRPWELAEQTIAETGDAESSGDPESGVNDGPTLWVGPMSNPDVEPDLRVQDTVNSGDGDTTSGTMGSGERSESQHEGETQATMQAPQQLQPALEGFPERKMTLWETRAHKSSFLMYLTEMAVAATTDYKIGETPQDLDRLNELCKDVDATYGSDETAASRRDHARLMFVLNAPPGGEITWEKRQYRDVDWTKASVLNHTGHPKDDRLEADERQELDTILQDTSLPRWERVFRAAVFRRGVSTSREKQRREDAKRKRAASDALPATGASKRTSAKGQ